MSWSVKVVKTDDGKSRVSLSYTNYEADMSYMLSTQANSLAHQLLIAGAECARLNNPPKKFF